ncbi:MAG TPA: hypothetical protein VFA47_12790, partial [Candidatus Manganitrophaceae bacterium]|nr:hypothetical protein [Candidatus Manganitrophaceae bacterium]
ASMILGGMGPVDPLTSSGAKIFASAYALFSGLAFIGIMGIVVSPIAHRMLHHFHADEEEEIKIDDAEAIQREAKTSRGKRR